MKTSERDLSTVHSLFTLPIEDEADINAVSAEFHRRVQRDLRIFNNHNRCRQTETLLSRLKAWWKK